MGLVERTVCGLRREREGAHAQTPASEGGGGNARAARGEEERRRRRVTSGSPLSRQAGDD